MKPSLNQSQGKQTSVLPASFDAGKSEQNQNLSKSPTKNQSLDLKKLDLSKDLHQSESSLQLLILVLNRSLKLSIEEILGLFTNNNKYLAHIIVKGVHQSFDGIRAFLNLINQNIAILLRIFQQNQKDTLACLYALKPGFISKDEQCVKLTLSIFKVFGKEIYNWFISKQSRCSQTLLLGLKRHQKLVRSFSQLLFKIIQSNEVEYFSNILIASASNEIQCLHIISKLLPYFEEYSSTVHHEQSLINRLENNGVFEKWFQIGQKLYQSQEMDNKILFIDFVGDFMNYLPQVVQKNASVINLLKRNWQGIKFTDFVVLVNQLIINLQKLSVSQRLLSKKLLNIIAQIFNQIYQNEQKRQFIIQSLISVSQHNKNLSLDSFIINYPPNHILNGSDLVLINLTINSLVDQQEKLIAIAQFLKEMLYNDIIINHQLIQIIILIVKKITFKNNPLITKFVNNLFKNILSFYVMLFFKQKNHLKTVKNTQQQQSSGNKKKNLQKSQYVEKTETLLLNKKMEILMNLVEKIIDTIYITRNSEQYIQYFKNYLLVTNSEIKKSNFGMSTKEIIHLMKKKLKITKQQQIAFEQQIANQQAIKSQFNPTQSFITKRNRQNLVIPSLSRVQVPEKVTRQFQAIIEKRKKDEQLKAEEEIKKKKQEQMKKLLHKKQLQKMNLIKGGFGQGQAQLKQQGFWNRFIKQTEEVKIYLNHQIQDAHLQGAQIIMKKYSKLFKYFFTNYSNTMYASKTTNFDENSQRKELLSAVEIIKFLKDYTLILATNLQQVQTIIKDINIKVFKKKQVVNEVDYQGFEEFIKQFCLCVWSRNQWRVGSKENQSKYDHLTLPQLLMNFIIYIRNVFKIKGDNMSYFDVGQIEKKFVSAQIQQLNKKLQLNPNFILPQGFKKISDKKIDFKPIIQQKANFPQSYKITLQVLNEILFEKLGISFIEPTSVKTVKYTVKPVHLVNVKQRDPVKIKARALSTVIQRKISIQSSLGMFPTKNQFSKGIKKGMLYLKPEQKIIGQQVAYKLLEMLSKFNDQENQKQEAQNKLKSIKKLGLREGKRSFSVQKIPPLQKNLLPQKPKLQIIQKVQHYIQSKKQKKLQQEKKIEQKTELKLKRKKQEDEKYFVELKLKLQENKNIKAEQSSRIRAAEQKEREKKREKKLKISQFTSKQNEKYKNMFDQMVEKKKKVQEEKQLKNQDEQQKMRRIRQKIINENKVLAQIRKQTTEAIMDILYGQNFKSMIKQYEVPLKAVFEYLLKLNSNPLSKRKSSPEEIDSETWSKFNKIFEISPLIVLPKDIVSIFKTVTKQKIANKEFSVGLNYEEFLHCLLRQSIKQKTIFGKIAERIRDQRLNVSQSEGKGKKSKSNAKKLQSKNQFEEEEQADVKKLLKQSDIRQDIIDHYGDVSTFSLESFRGLIFYLRMPFTKKGQQMRIKQLIEMQKRPQSQAISNLQRLKEKLKAEYKLQKNQKKDTANLQVTKIQKNQTKQQKNQSKLIDSQIKRQIKEKKDQKPTDVPKKTQKK